MKSGARSYISVPVHIMCNSLHSLIVSVILSRRAPVYKTTLSYNSEVIGRASNTFKGIERAQT